MATKHTGNWHINKHGVAAPCMAKQGNCPLGGPDTHFKNEREAQEYAYSQAAEKYGLLGIQEVIEISENFDKLNKRVDRVEQAVLPNFPTIEENTDELKPILNEDGKLNRPSILDKEVQRELFNGALDEIYSKAVNNEADSYLLGMSEKYFTDAKDFANEEMLNSLDTELKKRGSVGFTNKESFKEMFISAQIEGNIKAYEQYFKNHRSMHGEESELDYKWPRERTPSEERTIEMLENKVKALGKDERDELLNKYNTIKSNGNNIVNNIRANSVLNKINSFTELNKVEEDLKEFKIESTSMRFPEYIKQKIRQDFDKNPESMERNRKLLTKRAIYLAMKALES